jgi:predicted dienelactone hydrolase
MTSICSALRAAARLLLLCICTPLFAQDQVVTLAGRRVAVWQPVSGITGPQPVVIFSHGFGGCAVQTQYLMEALADHGYWVFAPNHKDARCKRRGGSTPDERFARPQLWSDKTHEDRAEDIRAIQSALETSKEFALRVDVQRLAYMGHSLGGYTMVGLAGGWSSWKAPGVKAVLALSPYVSPFVTHSTLVGVSVPIMYQGGTADLGITPWVARPEGAYDQTPAPKYFVEFDKAGHLAWSDRRHVAREQIIQYSIAFLDRYLRGISSDSLTTLARGVTRLWYDSELGRARLEKRPP